MERNKRRNIILNNYQDMTNRHIPKDTSKYIKIQTNNISCIDHIDIYLKINDGKIEDIKYDGKACIIALSSAAILSKMLIGKKIGEANIILDNYFNMIEGKNYEKEIVKEARVYEDISKQPSRKTCATLFAKGIQKEIK